MASGQKAHRFRKEITKVASFGYQLFLPRKYEDDRKSRWPLMLFLHGASARGRDVEMVKKNGPPKIVSRRQAFPFVVVSPQCPEGQRWQPDILMALLDAIVSRCRIDEDRIYVTGLSMGGYGTWALAGEYPDRFAAIVPICGGGMRYHARSIAQSKLPTWVFHGAKDDAVPLEESKRMVKYIKQFGGSVEFTVYPDAKHDAWTETYNNPELFRWLLSHRRTRST